MTRLPLIAAALLLAGCPTAPVKECTSGTECESGICLRDGSCEAPRQPGDGGSADAGTGADAGSLPADAGTGTGTDGGATGTPDGGGLCAPNADGTVTVDELPLRAGLSGHFRTAVNVTWDTAGQSLPDGGTAWNLAQALAGDAQEPLETLAVPGSWYAGDFPTATYAARLTSTSDLLGVFRLEAGGLMLLGIVSPQSGLSQTKVTYDPPVPVLKLPMKLGDSWQTTTTAMGTYQGVYSFWTESYTTDVTARGELSTPAVTFPVLRVSTKLVRTVGLIVTTTRSHAFVSECFGTVATVASTTNESEENFSSAAEIRRLAP